MRTQYSMHANESLRVYVYEQKHTASCVFYLLADQLSKK